MTAVLKEAKRVWREDGLITLAKKSVQFGYNTWIRPLLPKRVVSYNSVPVRASRLGDSLIPWQTRDIPGYESALVKGIRQYVESGDTVVVVGGGWGVSTVVAARQSGATGQVITFEGGAEAISKVEDTIELNEVDDHVSVRHAVVARAISIRGNRDNARVVPPADLPDCDVLVLDCEGAEVDILDEMEIRPRTVLVETHGMYNATKSDVQGKLNSVGYESTETMIAEERLRDTCEENGIHVIFSMRENKEG